MSGVARRPVASMTHAVVVTIEVERTDEEVAHLRLAKDQGQIAAFHDWMQNKGVYPMRGTGSGGPGFFHGVFEAQHAPAIGAWLSEQGLLS